MCGIAGAFNRDEAFALYEANLVRGRYSAGLLTKYVHDDYVHPTIIKTPTPFKKEEVPIGARMYLFHSRAPTSRTVEYREMDTHPFHVGSVYVAHNGILTNAEELGEKYGIDYSQQDVSMVDSYVIPFVINANKKFDSWQAAIVRSLEEFKGTFGLWIHIDAPGDGPITYICRSGSTLYGDLDTGSFSSSPRDGFKLLPEGRLFRIGPSNILQVDTFKTKPIYYIA